MLAHLKIMKRTHASTQFICVLGAQDPPAPELFTAEFVTDISDTPISIQVGGQVSDSFFCISLLLRWMGGFLLPSSSVGLAGSSSLVLVWVLLLPWVPMPTWAQRASLA